MRHIFQRLTPQLDRRWLLAALVVGVIVLVATYVRWGTVTPPLELVALSPEGRFQDTVALPASWADTATSAPDVVSRFPLLLGVRNPGVRPATPGRLEMALPIRYRLTSAGGKELDGTMEAGNPLITYAVDLDVGPIDPQRLPVLLPGLDTVWLEVVIPSYYCVSLADSIIEFLPAPPPPLVSLSSVQMFYSFQGGDMEDRQTGVLSIRLDTAALRKEMPPQPPSFPMTTGVEAAPEMESLQYVGSRQSRCGEPEDPMVLLSTVWETPGGGRFITLDYGGSVRKRLYDLNGDGVIERESWDPDGDGRFEATRRSQQPIPEFLLPIRPSAGFDLAAFDTIPADSLARLNPFREAMPGPGVLPPPGDTMSRRMGAPAPGLPSAESLPQPRVERPRPLGRPVRTDTVRRPPPDTGGG